MRGKLNFSSRLRSIFSIRVMPRFTREASNKSKSSRKKSKWRSSYCCLNNWVLFFCAYHYLNGRKSRDRKTNRKLNRANNNISTSRKDISHLPKHSMAVVKGTGTLITDIGMKSVAMVEGDVEHIM